jgi:hypothetical protein
MEGKWQRGSVIAGTGLGKFPLWTTGFPARASRYAASRGIGFQPMVAVHRDIDRYSDRMSTSGAIFCSIQKIAPLVLFGFADAHEYTGNTG